MPADTHRRQCSRCKAWFTVYPDDSRYYDAGPLCDDCTDMHVPSDAEMVRDIARWMGWEDLTPVEYEEHFGPSIAVPTFSIPLKTECFFDERHGLYLAWLIEERLLSTPGAFCTYQGRLSCLAIAPHTSARERMTAAWRVIKELNDGG